MCVCPLINYTFITFVLLVVTVAYCESFCRLILRCVVLLVSVTVHSRIQTQMKTRYIERIHELLHRQVQSLLFCLVILIIHVFYKKTKEDVHIKKYCMSLNKRMEVRS